MGATPMSMLRISQTSARITEVIIVTRGHCLVVTGRLCYRYFDVFLLPAMRILARHQTFTDI